MRRWMTVGLLLTTSVWCYSAKDKEPLVFLDMKDKLEANYSDSLQVLDVWDELHAMATLQGVVNRDEPRLYIDYVVCHMLDIDRHWWGKYRAPGQWLHGRDTVACASVEEAVKMFRHRVKGAVIYDPNVAATSNLASTVAGVEDLVAIRYDRRPQSLYGKLIRSGLLQPVVWLVHPDGTPMFTGQGKIEGLPEGRNASTGSVKGDVYQWMLEKYLRNGRCNTHYAGYYIDQFWRSKPNGTVKNHHTLTNHDFFVSKRGFFFDLSPWEDEPATDDKAQPSGLDARMLKALLGEAYRQNRERGMCYIGGFPAWAFKYTQRAGGKHEDVATEWQFSELISHYSAFKDADAIGYGAMANASFWQHFPLRKTYPQRWTSTAELQQKGLLDAEGKTQVKGKNYIIIYVGDYDASSWVSQRTPDIWDAPERGHLPMMWCISPVLSQRVPHVLHYQRMTATENDYFAAADNGAGYMMPGVAEAEDQRTGSTRRVKNWEQHCCRYYKQWGLSVTGFIIDGNGEAMGERGLKAYSRFSPNGIVPQKCEPGTLWEDMPILRSNWDLVSNNPKEAAQVLVDNMKSRNMPFHWYRCILKSPAWYEQVVTEAKRLDPSIELLDAPSFFELYRHWLREQNLVTRK